MPRSSMHFVYLFFAVSLNDHRQHTNWMYVFFQHMRVHFTCHVIMFILTYCLHNLIRSITSFWVMQFGCSGYNFQVNILKTKSDIRLVFYETFTPKTRNRINMSNQEILYLTSEVNRNHIRDNDVSSKVEIQRFLFCLLFSPHRWNRRGL